MRFGGPAFAADDHEDGSLAMLTDFAQTRGMAEELVQFADVDGGAGGGRHYFHGKNGRHGDL